MPPFPDNLQIARPADRMLWVWRLEGKGWFTIRDEYENLCGENWTENTMASRFWGMMEHFEKNKEATVVSIIRSFHVLPRGTIRNLSTNTNAWRILLTEGNQMIKLIRYKLAADKELEPQLWKSVARQFEENDGERVSVRTIRKQYQILPVLGYNPRTDTKYYDPFQNIKMEDLREEADQGGLANISKEEMAALSGRTAAPGGKLVDYQSESD